MIQIAKLEVKNFKSFKKATIPLSKGFTAIVGANGSGKSNLLDALLFGFGITSLKLLRAEKLTDLVHHNSEDGFARVTINLERGSDSFEITRIVDKSGKSVFRLNGKKSSLNELSSMLGELGIRADGYNIVVQGDITKIIEMNPKQRREIIDEIAGIKEFDEKKEESLKELQKVDDKIREARIVLSEREQYLNRLDEEKKLAEQFNATQVELQQTKATVLWLEINQLQKSQSANQLVESKLLEEVGSWNEKRTQRSAEIHALSESLEALNQLVLNAAEKTFDSVGRELEEKKSKVRVLEERIQTIQQQLNQWNEKKAQLQRRGTDSEQSEKTHSGKLEATQKEWNVVEQQLRSMETETLEKQWHESLQEFHHAQAQIKSLNESNTTLQKAKSSCPTCQAPLSDHTKKELMEHQSKSMRALEEKKSIVAKKNQELEDKIRHNKRWVSQQSELALQLAKHRSELESIQSRKKDLAEQLSEIDQSIQSLQSQNSLESQSLNQANGELIELEETYRKSVASSKELMESREKARKQLEQTNVEKNKLDDRVRKLEQQLNESKLDQSRNEVRLSDLEEERKSFEGVQLIPESNVQDLKRKIPTLEKEISVIGAVNLKAVGQFDELALEVENVRSKANQLEGERLHVLEMMERIEQRRNQVFLNCFESVAGHFSRIHFEFFNAEGKLSLTAPEQPLESGLLIESKIKGKELKNLDLLSGGEKTLAALAFLFSLQLHQPSPFYFFDEADAALDKENSAKLAKLIRSMCQKSQFVAITHNDAVVQEADQVVGVALNKDKSSVIGLQLREKEQMVA